MNWWCTISAQVVVSASVGARGSRRSEARWLGALWLSRPGTTVLVSCYLSSGIDLLCWSKVRSPHGVIIQKVSDGRLYIKEPRSNHLPCHFYSIDMT